MRNLIVCARPFLPAWLSPLLSAAALLSLAGVMLPGCATDTAEERQPENTLTESNCSQAGRADDIVRKTAMTEFQQFGKSCEPYEISTFPQNERETVWHVCCGGAALNFIFYPGKCVAHRASSMIECKN